jgi:hypothetical protein
MLYKYGIILSFITGTVSSLQVRKSQHSGKADRGSHVEKVMYMSDTGHRNTHKRFNMNIGQLGQLQQKSN